MISTPSTRWLPMVCLNLSLLCQVFSVGFGKQAALSMNGFSFHAVLSNRFYLLALLCLGLQSILWPIALRRYSLSFAYFYMSGSYAGILLMSYLLFHEVVTVFNITGAALIVTGVNLIVLGQPKGAR
jgi:multidrug transporter EmrE-like cation transporter